MPADEFTVQTPGDLPSKELQVAGGSPAGDDASAARIAELEGLVAQQAALISDLNAKLQAVETVPSRPKDIAAPRTIGEDWSNKTSAEAAAAGVRHTVRCSDGYYVPG